MPFEAMLTAVSVDLPLQPELALLTETPLQIAGPAASIDAEFDSAFLARRVPVVRKQAMKKRAAFAAALAKDLTAETQRRRERRKGQMRKLQMNADERRFERHSKSPSYLRSSAFICGSCVSSF
jgi:hypothetical protein